MKKRYPKVSFLIPVYNDEKHIKKTLDSLFKQDYKGVIELIFADGNSTDNSLSIVQNAKKSNQKRQIKIYSNPRRNTAVGRNICLKHATGEYIFNYSSHAYAKKDFVRVIVERLESSPADVGAVGASSNPLDKTQPFVGKCTTAVFATLLGGMGGMDQNISSGRERDAKSVAFTAYKKEVFKKTGSFDEDLWCGQDGELNIRVRKAGYRILFTPRTWTYHQKRGTLRKLWRQMYRYGVAAALRTKKHPDSFRILYMVPSLGVVGLAGMIVVSLYSRIALNLLGIGLIVYLIAGIVSVLVSSKDWLIAVCSPVFYLMVHFGYGLGFLRGVLGARFRD